MNKQNQSERNEKKEKTLEISRKHIYIHTHKQAILKEKQKRPKTPQKKYKIVSCHRFKSQTFPCFLKSKMNDNKQW